MTESAIGRVLEQRLEYVGLFVYREAESDSRYWIEATIEALDAALEYWIMRHNHGLNDVCYDATWNNEKGWDCDCLDK